MSDPEHLAKVADFLVAKKAAQKPEELTHHELAVEYLQSLKAQHQAAPVAAEGCLWTPTAAGLWTARSVEKVAAQVGAMFVGHRQCRRGSDYRQIAAHALTLADDDAFFSDAPFGLVTPSSFWRLVAHKATTEKLTAEHRQRFAIGVDPDFESEAPLWWRYLSDCFDGDHRDEQIELAAEVVGAALFGLARKLTAVALLLGPGETGKSTFLAVVAKLFPPGFVGAISPNNWDREYNVAALAGKRLNIVGELRDDVPLPAAPFKNVTGGDLIEGRHPTHRPFFFVCEAAHLFNSNTLPATTDRSHAFFRRWRILRFRNRVAAEQRDPDLADRIVEDELAVVLAWAIRGAERASHAGRLSTTATHEEVMRKWRIGSNPALLFLHDREFVVLDDGAEERASDIYRRYSQWAAATGHGRLSQPKFVDLMLATASTLGVTREERADANYWRGLRLVPRGLE